MRPFLDGLNAEQRAAVTLPATGPVHALILAGAGSGKTRVLTTRIAWLLSSEHTAPAGILAVTFTNKAAKEMTTRLAAMLPVNPRGMWIGTFHGLCNRLLRAHYRDAHLPQLFQILDSADQLAAIKRVIKAMGIDEEKYPPREVQHFINGHKEEGTRSAQVEAWDDLTRKRCEIYATYEAQCDKDGVVDFAELLLRAYELLARNEALRSHYQQRFRHILVDEFQDTNVLQYRWLKLFSPPGKESGASLFCVGDDDQSIYGFRGAQIGNMADFQREYGVRALIRLEQNYRSHGNILDAANAIIKNNRNRLGKNLWTDAGSGEPLRLYEAFADGEEARFIVEEIRTLVNEGYSRAQIALLYRSNAQSRLLEHQLFAAGLPYRVYGGQRFFERKEIKDALAYLRLVAQRNDDLSLSRVINFPPRAIGTRTLEQLQAAATQHACSLFAAIPHCATAVGGRAATALSGFSQLIDQLAGAAHLPLPELVDHVIELSGLRTHYQNEKEGRDRVDNLDELVNAANNFIAESGVADAEGEIASDLTAFLAHAALEAGEHQAGEGEDALQLMTVHAAKGLEFDVVFISGLEEGLFPHENSIQNDDVDEERRLMYVAITRARRRLYLSSAQTRMLHGQTRYNLTSRFLDELPAALIKRLTPARQFSGMSPAGQGRFAYAAAPARPAAHVRSGKLYPPASHAASPPPVPRRNHEPGTWQVGQNVRHAKFGEGVIVNAEGAGADARVQVRFREAGAKWLALAVAKLEAV